MKWTRLVWSIAFLGLCSCQTIPSPVPLQLPITVQDFFDACMAGDGLASLQIRGPEIEMSSLEVEWVGKENRDWKWEVTNPLGQTMLTSSYDSAAQKIIMGGQAVEHVPPLSIGKDGFIRVDGHFVGIRPEEMSCFLRMKFPQHWLERAYAYQEVETSGIILAADEERRIRIEVDHIQSVLKRRGCATVHWSNFLGMVRSQIKFCIKPGKKPSLSVTGLDDWQLGLTKIEE